MDNDVKRQRLNRVGRLALVAGAGFGMGTTTFGCLEPPALGQATRVAQDERATPATRSGVDAASPPTVAQSGETRWLADEPFWTSGVIEGESLFFVRHAPTERPRASLLFTPIELGTLRSATGETTYEPGRDYLWQPGMRQIELPDGSRIPFKTREELYPLPGTPNSYPSVRGQDRHILFGEGHFYHDIQAQVDYRAEELDWPVNAPRLRPGELPKTREKLRNGEPLSVGLFGDSISAGANATAFTKAPPGQPAYGKLVAAELQSRYGSSVSFDNYSRGGKTSEWGVEHVAPVAEAGHDLVLLAWGMNDISTDVPPEAYKQNIAAQIAAIREVNPDAEVVLVSSMRANPEWSRSTPAMFPQYVEALRDLTSDSVLLADVTSAWTEMLRRKSFYALTGNGVNHPNDFGHRVYAAVLLARLTDGPQAN